MIGMRAVRNCAARIPCTNSHLLNLPNRKVKNVKSSTQRRLAHTHFGYETVNEAEKAAKGK